MRKRSILVFGILILYAAVCQGQISINQFRITFPDGTTQSSAGIALPGSRAVSDTGNAQTNGTNLISAVAAVPLNNPTTILLDSAIYDLQGTTLEILDQKQITLLGMGVGSTRITGIGQFLLRVNGGGQLALRDIEFTHAYDQNLFGCVVGIQAFGTTGRLDIRRCRIHHLSDTANGPRLGVFVTGLAEFRMEECHVRVETIENNQQNLGIGYDSAINDVTYGLIADSEVYASGSFPNNIAISAYPNSSLRMTGVRAIGIAGETPIGLNLNSTSTVKVINCDISASVGSVAAYAVSSFPSAPGLQIGTSRLDGALNLLTGAKLVHCYDGSFNPIANQ